MMQAKKKYQAPKLEVVLFETSEDVMDGVGLSGVGEDPFKKSVRMKQFLNDLPNGTILNPEDYE